jgi:hypothetical protein
MQPGTRRFDPHTHNFNAISHAAKSLNLLNGKLGSEIEAYKVGPSNIYNVDETGFQLGQGKS